MSGSCTLAFIPNIWAWFFFLDLCNMLHQKAPEEKKLGNNLCSIIWLLSLSSFRRNPLDIRAHLSTDEIWFYLSYCLIAFTASSNACVKGHLKPTHFKSSPLFTFSTKLLGQDSPSIHLFSKIIGSRFTTAKIKLGEDSPSWFVFSRSRFAFKQRK